MATRYFTSAMRSKKKTIPEVTRICVETYQRPQWALSNIRNHTKPDCFNGIVAIRRWRITAELIPEPVEVLRERLLKLWADCDNFHHWGSLMAAATELGIELPRK